MVGSGIVIVTVLDFRAQKRITMIAKKLKRNGR
jgi:hypothetical protein